MAASAGSIRAGEAYVELSTRDSRLVRGLDAAKKLLREFGDSVAKVGQDLLKVSAVLSTPFVGGVKAFSDVEQELANLRAAANPTAEELAQIRAAIQRISQATGTGPADVASVFTELLKAGTDLKTVLGGAAESALQFSKVGGLDVANAAIVMSDAMNAFAREGLNAKSVVDALSKTADASSVSIGDITESFKTSSAVFGATGQKMGTLTAAIGVLGNAGVKGADAGTSLKTLLLSLAAPSDEAAKLMDRLGINVRDASGQLLPLRSIVDLLGKSLGGLDQASRDEALKKIFGSDAIRAALILLQQGTKGWDAFSAKLADSLPVSKKFAIITGTIQGRLQALWSALLRIGASIGDALASPLGEFLGGAMRVLRGIEDIVAKNKDLVLIALQSVVAIGAIGAALIALAAAAKAVAFVVAGLSAAVSVTLAVLGAIGTVVSALFTPLGFLTAAVIALGITLVYATGAGGKALEWLGQQFTELKDIATASFQGIADALAAGDLQLAAKILGLSLQVTWQKGIATLQEAWITFKNWLAKAILDLFFGAVTIVANAFYGIGKIWLTAVNSWMNLLGRFASYFKRTWNDLNGWVAKQWTSVLAIADPTINVDATNKRIDAQTKQQNDATSGNTLDARLGREQDLKDLETERQGVITSLANEASNQTSASDEIAISEIAKAESALNDARKEWTDAIADARGKREATAQTPSSDPTDDLIGRLKQNLADAGPAVQQASMKSMDVLGTFNVEAAFGFGSGTAAERTARASEDTARNTKRILQQMNTDGATFE